MYAYRSGYAGDGELGSSSTGRGGGRQGPQRHSTNASALFDTAQSESYGPHSTRPNLFHGMDDMPDMPAPGYHDMQFEGENEGPRRHQDTGLYQKNADESDYESDTEVAKEFARNLKKQIMDRVDSDDVFAAINERIAKLRLDEKRIRRNFTNFYSTVKENFEQVPGGAKTRDIEIDGKVHPSQMARDMNQKANFAAAVGKIKFDKLVASAAPRSNRGGPQRRQMARNAFEAINKPEKFYADLARFQRVAEERNKRNKIDHKPNLKVTALRRYTEMKPVFNPKNLNTLMKMGFKIARGEILEYTAESVLGNLEATIIAMIANLETREWQKWRKDNKADLETAGTEVQKEMRGLAVIAFLEENMLFSEHEICQTIEIDGMYRDENGEAQEKLDPEVAQAIFDRSKLQMLKIQINTDEALARWGYAIMGYEVQHRVYPDKRLFHDPEQIVEPLRYSRMMSATSVARRMQRMVTALTEKRDMLDGDVEVFNLAKTWHMKVYASTQNFRDPKTGEMAFRIPVEADVWRIQEQYDRQFNLAVEQYSKIYFAERRSAIERVSGWEVKGGYDPKVEILKKYPDPKQFAWNFHDVSKAAGRFMVGTVQRSIGANMKDHVEEQKKRLARNYVLPRYEDYNRTLGTQPTAMGYQTILRVITNQLRAVMYGPTYKDNEEVRNKMITAFTNVQDRYLTEFMNNFHTEYINYQKKEKRIGQNKAIAEEHVKKQVTKKVDKKLPGVSGWNQVVGASLYETIDEAEPKVVKLDKYKSKKHVLTRSSHVASSDEEKGPPPREQRPPRSKSKPKKEAEDVKKTVRYAMDETPEDDSGSTSSAESDAEQLSELWLLPTVEPRLLYSPTMYKLLKDVVIPPIQFKVIKGLIVLINKDEMYIPIVGAAKDILLFLDQAKEVHVNFAVFYKNIKKFCRRVAKKEEMSTKLNLTNMGKIFVKLYPDTKLGDVQLYINRTNKYRTSEFDTSQDSSTSHKSASSKTERKPIMFKFTPRSETEKPATSEQPLVKVDTPRMSMVALEARNKGYHSFESADVKLLSECKGTWTNADLQGANDLSYSQHIVQYATENVIRLPTFMFVIVQGIPVVKNAKLGIRIPSAKLAVEILDFLQSMPRFFEFYEKQLQAYNNMLVTFKDRVEVTYPVEKKLQIKALMVKIFDSKYVTWEEFVEENAVFLKLGTSKVCPIDHIYKHTARIDAHVHLERLEQQHKDHTSGLKSGIDYEEYEYMYTLLKTSVNVDKVKDTKSSAPALPTYRDTTLDDLPFKRDVEPSRVKAKLLANKEKKEKLIKLKQEADWGLNFDVDEKLMSFSGTDKPALEADIDSDTGTSLPFRSTQNSPTAPILGYDNDQIKEQLVKMVDVAKVEERGKAININLKVVLDRYVDNVLSLVGKLKRADIAMLVNILTVSDDVALQVMVSNVLFAKYARKDVILDFGVLEFDGVLYQDGVTAKIMKALNDILHYSEVKYTLRDDKRELERKGRGADKHFFVGPLNKLFHVLMGAGTEEQRQFSIFIGDLDIVAGVYVEDDKKDFVEVLGTPGMYYMVLFGDAYANRGRLFDEKIEVYNNDQDLVPYGDVVNAILRGVLEDPLLQIPSWGLRYGEVENAMLAGTFSNYFGILQVGANALTPNIPLAMPKFTVEIIPHIIKYLHWMFDAAVAYNLGMGPELYIREMAVLVMDLSSVVMLPLVKQLEERKSLAALCYSARDNVNAIMWDSIYVMRRAYGEAFFVSDLEHNLVHVKETEYKVLLDKKTDGVVFEADVLRVPLRAIKVAADMYVNAITSVSQKRFTIDLPVWYYEKDEYSSRNQATTRGGIQVNTEQFILDDDFVEGAIPQYIKFVLSDNEDISDFLTYFVTEIGCYVGKLLKANGHWVEDQTVTGEAELDLEVEEAGAAAVKNAQYEAYILQAKEFLEQGTFEKPAFKARLIGYYRRLKNMRMTTIAEGEKRDQLDELLVAMLTVLKR